jgi:uncharacterized RDD family membrane protein YckC
MKKATFFERLVAFLIDGLILGGGCVVLHVVGLAVWVAYETLLLSQWNGQTIGKKVVGIRVVTASGAPPDWLHAMIRSLSRVLSSILLLGYLWVLWDADSQAWHDKLAETYVTAD